MCEGLIMEDKYFDLEEMMVDYSQMTSFDFESSDYLALKAEKEVPVEYSHQLFTFKYGNFDMLDMLQAVFSKGANYVKSL